MLAFSAVAGAVEISSRLADARRDDRQAYAAALAEREAAALAAAPAGAAAGVPARAVAATGPSRTLCLRGAETVVARVARFLDSRVIDQDRRLDVAALARLSRRAAAADRGAALPQRMGRRRVLATSVRSEGVSAPEVPPDPDGGAAPVWEPIEPPDRICVELAEAARGAPPHGSRRAIGAK